jgi:hypothetical protein
MSAGPVCQAHRQAQSAAQPVAVAGRAACGEYSICCMVSVMCVPATFLEHVVSVLLPASQPVLRLSAVCEAQHHAMLGLPSRCGRARSMW